MTRPTDEQIKALRKGDVVTVRAVVVEPDPDDEGDIQVSIESGDRFNKQRCILPSEIMTIEPREIKVGDRVRYRGVYNDIGTVRYIEANKAAVMFESGVFHAYSLNTLEVIP